MDKNFKPVYIRGTETGKGVIEALKILGGKNNCGYNGTDDTAIYYILPSGYIGAASTNSTQGSYIMATAEELKPARWRAERTETYYTLDSTMDVIESSEYGDRYDDGRYESGNYFRTRRDAEKAAEIIKKMLLP
jgi:hypothetical protein